MHECFERRVLKKKPKNLEQWAELNICIRRDCSTAFVKLRLISYTPRGCSINVIDQLIFTRSSDPISVVHQIRMAKGFNR